MMAGWPTRIVTLCGAESSDEKRVASRTVCVSEREREGEINRDRES